MGRARFENVQDLRCSEPAAGQVEEGKERVEHLAFFAHPAVGDAEGDEPGVARRKRKDCLDKGSIRFDIRRHDENVLGEECGIAREERKEDILEYFDFSHGTMAGMDLDGIISLADFFLFTSFPPPVPEVQDIGLYRREEGFFPRLRE